jgi:dihydrofolate reductase
MRSVRYNVAMSLDGYIAGPSGEHDWIVMDPDIDFGALMGRYDTYLVGRKTWEAMAAQGQRGRSGGPEVVVFSRTLDPAAHARQRIVADDARAAVLALKEKPGKDIWLFGGGELFRSLLAEGVVDVVEVAVIPVLLGGGVPLLPSPAPRVTLRLSGHRVYEKTGTVTLEYEVTRASTEGRSTSRGRAGRPSTRGTAGRPRPRRTASRRRSS